MNKTFRDEIVRSEYEDMARALGFVAPPTLSLVWIPGEDCAGETLFSEEGPATLQVSIAEGAGAARVASLLVHELTHARARVYCDHGRMWRRAYANHVLILFGVDVHDAEGVPHCYDLDRVVEYRLQHRAPEALSTLQMVLGEGPRHLTPRYRVATPLGHVQVAALTARVLATGLRVSGLTTGRWARLHRDLRTLPMES